MMNIMVQRHLQQILSLKLKLQAHLLRIPNHPRSIQFGGVEFELSQ